MHTWKANTNNDILPRPSSGSHDTQGILHLPQQITNCKIYQNQRLYLLKRMTYSFSMDKGQITDKTKSTWKQNSNKTCPKVTESKYIIWASCPIKTWRKLNRKEKNAAFQTKALVGVWLGLTAAWSFFLALKKLLGHLTISNHHIWSFILFESYRFLNKKKWCFQELYRKFVIFPKKNSNVKSSKNPCDFRVNWGPRLNGSQYLQSLLCPDISLTYNSVSLWFVPVMWEGSWNQYNLLSQESSMTDWALFPFLAVLASNLSPTLVKECSWPWKCWMSWPFNTQTSERCLSAFFSC